MNDIPQRVANEFSQLVQVQAVALSGSMQNNLHDDDSDFDLYVYSSSPVSLEFRSSLAANFTDKCEIGNAFWEDGDEWKMPDSRDLDIMYRSCDFPKENIDRTFRQCVASVGFTTCFLNNIHRSAILFDRDNWFKTLQDILKAPYPENLAKAIVRKNYPILSNNISNYRNQVEKALRRGDLVSVNHRVAAFLASYFDILFAINKKFHPGEKRLVQTALETCEILPPNFERDIHSLFSPDNKTAENLGAVYRGLDMILAARGYTHETPFVPFK